MARWLSALFCALVCHGLFLFMPIFGYNPVSPQLTGDNSIKIHLTPAAINVKSTTSEQGQQKVKKEAASTRAEVQQEPPQKMNPVQAGKTGQRPEKLIQSRKKACNVPTIKPQSGKKRTAVITDKKSTNQQNNQKKTAHPQHTTQSLTDGEGSPVPAIVKARPLYTRNPKPPYPPLARRRGWQGTVILKVTVSENGLAAEVALYKSSGYPLLDSTAKQTVHSWRFHPGSINGRPATMNVLIPVHFKLH